MAEKDAGSKGEFKVREIPHVKCGGTYIARAADEVVGDEVDCPICAEVRQDHAKSGGLVNRSSYGTPLAKELGLIVTYGEAGPVHPQ